MFWTGIVGKMKTLPSRGETVAGRVARGASAATARQLVMYVATAISMLVLARLLVPKDFGVYVTLVGVAAVSYNLVTVGFVYTFTRSFEHVSEQAIRAAYWTFQCFYALVAAALATFALTATAGHERVLLCCLALFFVLAPVRFPAVVSCWRNIELGKLALIEAAEGVTLQLSAVGLVVAGLGVDSFGFALVAGAMASVTMVLLLTRWAPGRPTFAPLRPWFARARPYFLSGLLGLWKDSGQAPMLAAVFGTTLAGFYGWAAGFAIAALALSVVLSQAMFVGFSQVRDPVKVADAINFALRALAGFAGAVIAVIAGGTHPLTVVVFATRWLPAVAGLRLLLVAVALSSMLMLFVSLALADGHVRSANRWLVGLVASTIALGLPAAALLGLEGYAGAYLFSAGAVLCWGWRITSRRYPLARNTGLYIVMALVSGLLGAAVGWIVAGLVSSVAASLFVSWAAGLGSYLTILMIVSRGGPWQDMKRVLLTLRS